MNSKVSKLIRAVYPPQMVSRVKSIFQDFSLEERKRAIEEMKKDKRILKNSFKKILDRDLIKEGETPF